MLKRLNPIWRLGGLSSAALAILAIAGALITFAPLDVAGAAPAVETREADPRIVLPLCPSLGEGTVAGKEGPAIQLGSEAAMMIERRSIGELYAVAADPYACDSNPRSYRFGLRVLIH
jgi:hypothetical protein